MKKLLLIAVILLSMVGCQRVPPNYAGVLMSNYGKAGKDDFSIQTGRVNMLAPGTELFLVPLWEQRAQFESNVVLKDADNNEFYVQPRYSYKVLKSRSIDVAFDNKHLGNGGDFMNSIEDNRLEPRIRDLMKEFSRKHTTNELMESGGNVKFEEGLQSLVEKEMNELGFELLSFSSQLDFTNEVKHKINNRNEVDQNLAVLEKQILEARKKNELEKLIRDNNRIKSEGLTDRVLAEMFIEKVWSKVPSLSVTFVHK